MKPSALASPCLALLLIACASAPPTPPVVPDAIKAGAGEKLAFVRHARGVQIYRCDAAEGAAMRWVFVAPEAQLFENSGAATVLGTHGAGPFWQANDGSRTVGKVAARADAPQPAADIPWLLLSTTASGSPGQMAAVSSIQRIRTAGGVAPAAGCAAAADAGKTARVPYTSDYVFFVRG
jgi:Protein of unknown function (DUF3455)